MEYEKPAFDPNVRYKGANRFWWEQVDRHMGTLPFADYRQAEVDLFSKIYLALRNEGKSIQAIKDEFAKTYGIQHSAFYTRVHKAQRGRPIY